MAEQGERAEQSRAAQPHTSRRPTPQPIFQNNEQRRHRKERRTNDHEIRHTNSGEKMSYFADQRKYDCRQVCSYF
jgi:hypothetical protein